MFQIKLIASCPDCALQPDTWAAAPWPWSFLWMEASAALRGTARGFCRTMWYFTTSAV